jgi:N6-L-threonylcarbamoyladenine synthase
MFFSFFLMLGSLRLSRRYLSTQRRLILGIETSCDDTGVAIVDDQGTVVFEALSSQWSTHAPHGGVVPKLAKRDHELNLPRLLGEAEKEIGSFEHLSGVAVTAGPGLALCLRVGYRTGRELAHQKNLPFVAVNHLEAHLLVPRMEQKNLDFPFLAMLVSGGHCMLLLTRGVNDHVRLGTTHDDSLGEAYDKVARVLGLGFGDYEDGGGGGAALERLAREGDENSVPFPVPLRNRKDCMFSFSGLKTAVFLVCEKFGGDKDMSRVVRANVAASFQKAARIHLQQRLKHAMRWCDGEVERGTLASAPTKVVVTGGVASNMYLRDHLTNTVDDRNEDRRKEYRSGDGFHSVEVEEEKRRRESAMEIVFPPVRLCTDNGVMVAWAGHERMSLGMVDDSTPPEDGIEMFKTRWPLGNMPLVKSKIGRILKDSPDLSL